MVGDRRLRLAATNRFEPEVGQALGEQALRRAIEERSSPPAGGAGAQAASLRLCSVVPGIGLVGDEVPERGGEHGQVGVDAATRLRRSPR